MDLAVARTIGTYASATGFDACCDNVICAEFDKFEYGFFKSGHDFSSKMYMLFIIFFIKNGFQSIRKGVYFIFAGIFIASR